jgi:hypothetical protein
MNRRTVAQYQKSKEQLRFADPFEFTPRPTPISPKDRDTLEVNRYGVKYNPYTGLPIGLPEYPSTRRIVTINSRFNPGYVRPVTPLGDDVNDYTDVLTGRTANRDRLSTKPHRIVQDARNMIDVSYLK